MSVELEAKVERLSEDVKALRSEVHDLVEAWNTARGVVKFVKWLGSVAIAVTSIWALVKLGSAK